MDLGHESFCPSQNFAASDNWGCLRGPRAATISRRRTLPEQSACPLEAEKKLNCQETCCPQKMPPVLAVVLTVVMLMVCSVLSSAPLMLFKCVDIFRNEVRPQKIDVTATTGSLYAVQPMLHVVCIQARPNTHVPCFEWSSLGQP